MNQYDHFLATVRHATAVQDIDGDGELDTLVPAGVAEDLDRMGMRDSRFRILRGCAHAPFISHPAESLEVLNSFIGAPGPK